MHNINKLKIFNDPVYGFISIPNEIIFDILEHPYFQRLRRISQTGLSYYVYPGCTHSRFLHALGCLHLMQKAVNTLRAKGVEITSDEEQGVYLAILLHDVGHGPFSHALENTLVEGVHHEQISLQIMQELNVQFDGALEVAIALFQKKYPKKFLSQLISSQLDVDRLDYLKRDSFFSGVAEGNINSDRIISMMNVADGELVVDAKGIYSIEKYLISRMFMYWQVYLHKTSVAAEIYLIKALKRAKTLALQGEKVAGTPQLNHFLTHKIQKFSQNDLEIFCQLDDTDVMYSLKSWQNHSDPLLSFLSQSVVQRKLPKAEIRQQPVNSDELAQRKQWVVAQFDLPEAADLIEETLLNITPYEHEKYPIRLMQKDHSVVDLGQLDQQILADSLTRNTKKYHFCYWTPNKFERLKPIKP